MYLYLTFISLKLCTIAHISCISLIFVPILYKILPGVKEPVPEPGV